MPSQSTTQRSCGSFSALQRAEIAEMAAGSGWIFCVSRFSALQRAEIAEIFQSICGRFGACDVSVLFNEPKLLKCSCAPACPVGLVRVSVLFNEPKLLKSPACLVASSTCSVSVLFNEPKLLKLSLSSPRYVCFFRFSALQRAEIAEMVRRVRRRARVGFCFSALQRAEIAEIWRSWVSDVGA